MGRADYWKPNDYNAICDVCGFKYKASELRKRWDGVMTCPDDWEPRHPQDFVRGVKDSHPLPFTRTEGIDEFVQVGGVDAATFLVVF